MSLILMIKIVKEHIELHYLSAKKAVYSHSFGIKIKIKYKSITHNIFRIQDNVFKIMYYVYDNVCRRIKYYV